MLTRVSKRRFWFVNLLLALIFPVIIFQLTRLSLSRENIFVRLARKQHNLLIEIPPKRGIIYDRNHKELAMNLKIPSIYAVPRLIEKKKELASKLSKILDKDQAFLLERLSRDKAFVWLERGVSQNEAKEIEMLKDSNIGILYENRRFYPNNELFANVLGFCNIDNEGIEGLEMTHDKYLKGRPGYRKTKRDALGREVVAFEEKFMPAVDGADIVLTIDHYIQYVTERSLDQTFRKYKAKGAMAVVMDPQTGEILAMANRPTFDPNRVSSEPPDERRNRVLTDIFEPGSIFKMITATAALAEKKVALTDTFNCENGEWRVRPKRVIHDVHPYKILTFPQVIQKSSNIGTVKIAMRLGEELMYRYSKRFGFGELTGIDLPGEVRGILHPLSKWSKVSITSVPYGQEVAATTLQMVAAVSVIANGGKLMRPYVVDEVRDRDVILKKTLMTVRDHIIQPDIAATMNSILQLVVEEGTGKAAQIKGIKVAGKTGTSQKLEGKTYSHSHFVSSFIGYAPAEDPKLAMMVAVDDPRGAYYGGVVAAPVFKEVVEASLLYLGYVPPGSKLAMPAPEEEGVVPAVSVTEEPKKLELKKIQQF
ncbi:MAG: penicillin-binding protein [Candidatus Omnitrophica bacterium]|nr:penicillin-binding protein [Candidatus Omnitrophota bacterium]